MLTAPVSKLTPQQYLDIERKAEFKSEFFRGEMFAMSGVSLQHNRISGNLIAALHGLLQDHRCEAYGSDMRVQVSKTGLYTYPDVSIACGQPQFADSYVDTLLTPRVLFEILSDSTEQSDRGTKFTHYRQIESLQESVLVSQTEPRVEVFQRVADDIWLLKESRELTDSFTLESVGIALTLSEVCLRVEFPDPDTSVA